MNVNAKSVFLGSKYVIPQMLLQEKNSLGDRGWIINISSIYGLTGGKHTCKTRITCVSSRHAKNAASYAASKGAVTNLTRQVARDYAEDGIHCNAICPGCWSCLMSQRWELWSVNSRTDTQTAIFLNTIKTADSDEIESWHPLHGVGSPEDLVGAAVFLASDEARWITGINLPVDGGYMIR